MIRFSAGLVVVALGVLIGGVVTSKLSLVYVSIAVSALALIAWAIGVFLKRGELREELFGGRPELVPAGAGVGAGLPAPERSASAPQSPAPSPATAVPSAGQDRPAHGQGGLKAAALSSPAQVRPTWAAREPEPQPAPDRVAVPAGGWGSTSTPASGTSSVAPRAWDGAKEPLAPPPVPAGTGTTPADAGSADALRSWFDRPAPADTPSMPWTRPSITDTPSITGADTSGDVDVPADEDDDDWPTRYSWLDDEETDEAVESDDVPIDDALKSDDAVESVLEASELAEPTPAASKSSDAPEPAASQPPAATAARAKMTPRKPARPQQRTPSPRALTPTDDAPASPSATDLDLGQRDDRPKPSRPPKTTSRQPKTSRPPSRKSDAKLVTVVPGVPRYHEPNCILIRFMPEDDVQQKSIPEAKAAKCTPCAACQPED